MAGIYIHIPFCKQACHYCDFHFSVNLSFIDEVVDAIIKEIAWQRDYLGQSTVQTLYLGGGTPSILGEHHLKKILLTVREQYKLNEKCEVTLEANPDDLSQERLEIYKKLDINRLSIGIQSFDDEILAFLNRSHSSQQARQCIVWAQNYGFKNINVDLIYGIPGQRKETWHKNVEKVIDYEVAHISAYALCIEKKTTFGNWFKKNMLMPCRDEEVINQYEYLSAVLAQAGYWHYEISSFCKPYRQAQHNKGYWEGKPYLGIGPGAHSFNKISRQHNVRSNQRYIQSIARQSLPCTVEWLTKENKINEYLMTTLRTSRGCNFDTLRALYDYDIASLHHSYLKKLEEKGLAKIRSNQMILTTRGKFLADKISTDLFV